MSGRFEPALHLYMSRHSSDSWLVDKPHRLWFWLQCGSRFAFCCCEEYKAKQKEGQLQIAKASRAKLLLSAKYTSTCKPFVFLLCSSNMSDLDKISIINQFCPFEWRLASFNGFGMVCPMSEWVVLTPLGSFQLFLVANFQILEVWCCNVSLTSQLPAAFEKFQMRLQLARISDTPRDALACFFHCSCICTVKTSFHFCKL